MDPPRDLPSFDSSSQVAPMDTEPSNAPTYPVCTGADGAGVPVVLPVATDVFMNKSSLPHARQTENAPSGDEFQGNTVEVWSKHHREHI